MEILDDIIKKYGNGVVLHGQDLIEHPKSIIRVSPAIDVMLGGGIPEGTFSIFTGPPKCGKSLTALVICRNAQIDGRPCYYLNIEGRIKSRDVSGITGLDTSKLVIIGSTKGKILSAEEYLQIAEQIAKDVPNSVIIIDSISALCTEKELTNDVGEAGRNSVHLLLSNFCKKISNIVSVNNNIIIAITHLIANTSGWGASVTESGGNKIKYQSDIRIRAKNFEKWTVSDDENSKQIGQKVNWTAETTAIVGPGRTAVSYIKYGYGIDEVAELVSLGKTLGFITTAGPWTYFKFLDDGSKFQGFDKALSALSSNKDHQEALRNKIYEMVL